MIASPNDIAADDERLARVVSQRARSAAALTAAQDAFEVLYRRHARLLLAFLASRGPRADLDDLHQEIWHRAWRHLPDGFAGGNFRAWLHQIARNALIDLARKKRPDPLDNEGELPNRGDDGPGDRLIEQERAETLRRCLEKLDSVAGALVKARLGGEDYAAICQKMGLKPERAHKIFHQAKDQLQHCVRRDSS